MAYDFEFEVAVGETKTFDLSSKSYGASINNISYVGAARTYVTCVENASDDSKLDVTGNAEGVAVVDVSAGRLALSIQITVTAASVEDQNFLNERGLAHFWENIDDIKQNKLTAGAGISITNDVISATGDSTLSPTSTNPIQNQAVYNAIGDVESILTTLNIGGGAQ